MACRINKGNSVSGTFSLLFFVSKKLLALIGYKIMESSSMRNDYSGNNQFLIWSILYRWFAVSAIK